MYKNFLTAAAAIALISFGFMGCQKTEQLNPIEKTVAKTTTAVGNGFAGGNASIVSDPACAGPYNITLESVVNNGNATWTWTWSVMNPNPGNGTNGTVQNLSHWDVTLGQCVLFEDVISGATSADNITWIPFTPTYEQDQSMMNVCNLATGNVVKFNFGTTGAAKSYYRLTINKNVQVDPAGVAFYKGGVTTGCGQICFPGFGCQEQGPLEGCAFSQGYWFAKPGVVWPDVNGADAGQVTIGGKFYTQAEGVAIWNTSNSGGISDAKKGFLQTAAILLSGNQVFPTASVWANVAIVQNWLAGKPKLSANAAVGTLRVQPRSAANTNAAAGTAAGNIGNWINANHCEAW